MNKPQRNIEIDIMKGVGILLVMIGHAAWCPRLLGTFIASFHMPLFFIISGYFIKTSEDTTISGIALIRKDFKQLIIPYIVVVGITCSYILLQAIHYQEFDMFTHAVARYSLAMDTIYEDTLIDKWIGPMWFVMALFWGRLLFFHLSKMRKLFLPLCIALSLIMIIIIIHPYVPTPFGIGQGIASLFYLEVGYIYRKYGISTWLKIVAVMSWCVSIYLGPVNVSSFEYNCIPINLIGACGGTLVLYYISKGIAKTFMEPFFSWCGRNSLVILCAHSLELKIPAIHLITKVLPFKLPQMVYFSIKHAVTLFGAWSYDLLKQKYRHVKLQ